MARTWARGRSHRPGQGAGIAPGAVVVLEQAPSDSAPEDPDLAPADERTYGETRILIFRDAASSTLGGGTAA